MSLGSCGARDVHNIYIPKPSRGRNSPISTISLLMMSNFLNATYSFSISSSDSSSIRKARTASEFCPYRENTWVTERRRQHVQTYRNGLVDHENSTGSAAHIRLYNMMIRIGADIKCILLFGRFKRYNTI